MSSNDSIAGGGGSASDEDSPVAGGGGDGGKAGQSRLRRPSLRIYIVVSDKAGGMWRGFFLDRASVADTHRRSVVALALTQIVASSCESPITSPLQQRLRGLALDRAKRASVEGFLEYKIEALCRLDTPFALEGAELQAPQLLDLLGQQPGASFVMQAGGAASQEESVGACLLRWQAEAGKLLQPAIVALTAPLAKQVVAGTSMHLHCVALTGKIERKRLLAQDDAPKKRLRQLRAELEKEEAPAAASARTALVEKRWAGSRGVRSPELMLQWLECSENLKQQRRAGRSAEHFAKLLSVESGVPVAKLLGNLKSTSGRLLIKSRIRLDCAANLAHRAWWSQARLSVDVSVHIFCDASPQWRGIELFATTVDIVVDGCLYRRLAPLVSLSKAQLDHHGKLGALLWQLFLMCGPTFEDMASFCRAVRSVTTDLGTERLLSDSPACLEPFFEKLDLGAPQPAGDSSPFLFSRCLFMPGFRHVMDNVLQKGLCSMQGFPGFLQKLKSVVRFLRSELVVGEVCRSLERDGQHALAEMVRGASLVSFAAWRWGTLAEVCAKLGGFLDSLSRNFDPTPFTQQRDSAEFRQVLLAFRSAAWRRTFEFVGWFSRHLSELMSWVGGCPCHPVGSDGPGGGGCDRKGRRLVEAHSKVEGVVGSMLSEANEWAMEDFGGDTALWREAQGVVRFACLYAREKCAFFDKIPYLLARLGEAA